jgi:TPR repeat protein
MKMNFDNPFPAWPSNPPPPQRSQTMPIENGMANMNIGRPNPEQSRPTTSASKTSNKSGSSYQSDNSHYETDPTSYESSTRESFDRMGPGPFDQRAPDPRGPPLRSMTMPNEVRPPPGQDRLPPGQDRLPPIRQGNGPDYGYGQRPRDPVDMRSNSAMGSRPPPGNGPGMGLARAQTFNTRPPPRDELDEYMPNFDAVPETNKVEDALGLPLDSAPGIPRPATRVGNNSPSQQSFLGPAPSLNRSKSQPDLRGQENGYGLYDAPDVPPMPNGMPQNGYGPTSQEPMSRNNQFMGPPGYGGQGGRGGPPPGPRSAGLPPGPLPVRPGLPHRLDTQQGAWSDPGPGGRGEAPMSAPAGGSLRSPPGRFDQQESMSNNPDSLPYNPMPAPNPDALPGHPTPVRPGLMQNGPPPPQQQRRAPINNQQPLEEEPPEKPVTWLELNDLRDYVKGHPSDYKTQFKLAKRLVEAADVLVNEDQEADSKTRIKNREKFILEAHKIVKKLVQHSYPDAIFYLADCYGTGQLGLAVDHKEAFNLYQAAAKLGHGPSAYRTAICCEVGGEGTRKDPLKSVQWYRRAAALGEVGAMYKLGMVLLKGLLGQQQSFGEAVIWLNRAAERADAANPHALHELGFLHEYPPRNATDKIIRDEEYSLQLYEQAAKLGYARSQTRLGKAFEQGALNVPQDDRASIHWYSKAAAQGDAEAELALSGWYLTGSRGVLETNDTEAYLWARKSAMKEFPKAEFAMGYYSEVGIGCPKNLEDAKRWYGRAACKL